MIILFFFFQFISVPDLESNQYNGFYFEDSSNRIWVSSPMAWNCIDIFDTKIYETQENYIQSSLYEDEFENLYSTSQDHILFKSKADSIFSVIKLKYQDVPLNEDYHISHIDTLNNRLLFSADQKLFWLDYINFELELISHSLSRRFYYHKERELIIGCPWILGSGLELFLYDKGKWKKEVKHDFEFDFNVSQVVFHGNETFLATNIGLMKFNMKDQSIVNVPNINADCQKVNYIVEYQDQIICSYENCGLSIYNIDQDGNIQYEDFRVINDLISTNNPQELFIDSKNFLYVSHPGLDVQKMDLNSLGIKNVAIGDKEIHSFMATNDNSIFITNDGTTHVFFEDGREETIYYHGNLKITDNIKFEENIFISSLNGVYLLDVSGKKFVEIISLDDEVILDLSVYKDNLVIGTTERTYSLIVNNLISNDEFFKHFGLNGITGIACDSDVCLIQDINNKGYYFSSDTLFQLKAEIVFDIGRSESHFYANTSNGIMIVDNEGNQIRSFPNLDKDVIGFCTRSDTSIIVTENEIYFSTDNNLIKYPYKLDYSFLSQEPIKVVNGFAVAHKSGYLLISDEMWNSYRDKPNLEIICDATVINERISFPYRLSKVKLELKVSDTYDLNNTKVEYSLDNESFRQVSDLNDLSLNNLYVGKHRLLVRLIGSNFQSVEKSISITVLPPYHQTWWFRTLCILGLISIGFLISYIRTRQKLKQQQIKLDRQEALQSQRNRMSQDLHDEMGSGLSAIKHLSVARSTKDKDQQIESIATNLIRSMRDLLWSLDESNDTVHSLSVKIRQTANQLLRNSSIQHKVKVTLHNQEVSISGPTRRNLILVTKEIINNAIKHSQATAFDIIITSDDKALYMDITDNGIGYDTSTTSTGYGLKSINKRLVDIGSSAKVSSDATGTHIHISLPIT